MLVHLLSAAEARGSRAVGGTAQRTESKGQGGACPREPRPCDPRLRRQDADRLVSIREAGGTPEDRRATDLPRGRRARRDGDALENHLLLRGEKPSREGRREVRAPRRARFDPETGRGDRRGVSRRVREDGRSPGG